MIAASFLQSVNSETPTSSRSKPQPLPTTVPSENPTVSTSSQSETSPNALSSGNEQQFVNSLENNPLEDKNVIF